MATPPVVVVVGTTHQTQVILPNSAFVIIAESNEID
jgi:hypothetical protein